MSVPPAETPSLASKAASIQDEPEPSAPTKFKPTKAFWLVFVAVCTSCFLSALDLTSVSTALPAIAEDLQGSDWSWIGSSYALVSTALIPWIGGLAAIFGRRAVMNGSLVLFAIGSALSGAAPSMSILIAGRAVQGAGGGGILVMSEIIVTDMIPLSERGLYLGILGAVWALASAIGPPIGGALASAGAWRWLFYMNLFIFEIGRAHV